MTSLLFAVTIAVGCILSSFACIQNSKLLIVPEKRLPTAMPGISAVGDDWPLFAGHIESFINDRFPARLHMVALRNSMLLNVFATSGVSSVALGKDRRWLFYFLLEPKHAQINYPGFSSESFRHWIDTFEGKREFLARHGIKYVVIIAPEKGTIYPEFLPESLGPRAGLRRIDALQEYFSTHTNVELIDAKKALLDEKARLIKTKSDDRLYYLGDSHWNYLAAAVVMRKLAAQMSQPMPGYTLTPRFPEYGDLARLLNLATSFPESGLDLKIANSEAHRLPEAEVPYASKYGTLSAAYRNANERLPKIFVVHDSFADFLKPYLAECASFSQFYIRRDFDPADVLAQNPDILIEELSERNLYLKDRSCVPQSVRTVAASQKSEATVSGGIGKPLLASFDEGTELVDLATEPADERVIVKLLWRSRVRRPRNNQINFFTLDADGRECSVKYYLQDPFSRVVQQGTEWIDTIDIPAASLRGATQFGVMLCDRKGAISSRASRTDVSSTRVLIPIKDSVSNWDTFEKSYRYTDVSVLKRAMH